MPSEKPSRREWRFEPIADPESGQVIVGISDQLARQLSRLAIVLEDIGGAIAVASRRVEVEPGIYETLAVDVRWESFVPAQRQPREAPQPEPEPVAAVEDPEPDPVEEPEPAAA